MQADCTTAPGQSCETSSLLTDRANPGATHDDQLTPREQRSCCCSLLTRPGVNRLQDATALRGQNRRRFTIGMDAHPFRLFSVTRDETFGIAADLQADVDVTVGTTPLTREVMPTDTTGERPAHTLLLAADMPVVEHLTSLADSPPPARSSPPFPPPCEDSPPSPSEPSPRCPQTDCTR